MRQEGTLRGEYARKYPGWHYRKPVRDTRVIDYETMMRVYPDREYPRYTDPPDQPVLRTTDCADYLIMLREDHPMDELCLWLQPNQYTQAKRARLLQRIYVSHGELHWREYCESLLEQEFK